MDRETLLAELNRLLDLGEPLLTMFPKQRPDGYQLQLPDSISDDMRWYAAAVAVRSARSGKYMVDDWWDVSYDAALAHQVNQPRSYTMDDWWDDPTGLSEAVEGYKAGLLGWRAVGVLK